MNKKEIKKGILPYVILIAIMLVVIYLFNVMNVQVNDLTYDKFISNLNNDEVTEITIIPSIDGGVYNITGKLKDYDKNESFSVQAPLSDEVMKDITDANDKYDFKISTEKDPNSSMWLYAIINFLPLILIGVFMFVILTKQMGGFN